MIFMRKIGIIFLSVIMVVLLAACNSGGGKTKKVTGKQTESVKATEEAMERVKSTEEATETAVSIQEEASTETVTGAVSQEDNKETDSKEQQKSYEDSADSGNQHSKSAEAEQGAGNANNDNGNNSGNNSSGNSSSGSNTGAANEQADRGNAGQDSGGQQTPQTVSYSPQNVVSLATAKCQAGGMITTQQNLDNLLARGKITQDEYKEYYPYDGLDSSYYSVFVETDLNIASTTSGQPLRSEDAIATYIADMLLLESNPVFNVVYAVVYSRNGTDFYEFRCLR